MPSGSPLVLPPPQVYTTPGYVGAPMQVGHSYTGFPAYGNTGSPISYNTRATLPILPVSPRTPRTPSQVQTNGPGCSFWRNAYPSVSPQPLYGVPSQTNVPGPVLPVLSPRSLSMPQAYLESACSPSTTVTSVDLNRDGVADVLQNPLNGLPAALPPKGRSYKWDLQVTGVDSTGNGVPDILEKPWTIGPQPTNRADDPDSQDTGNTIARRLRRACL
eukprot:CAMPEP_0194501718 /NCGR_PEP_ID=MMETSP0253-20130528/22869_1 /TAXON_ID=2966 /ORGANISM="Noctiluca scintillans" /LENGTH=216 /DNA_ID=CAMNT_0039343737 /DNA_START=123 /DNA_END=773 /DNA_ORIENTATION=+